MSKMMRSVFIAHTFVSGITGLILLLIPGRFLLWIGWAPIDPVLSRVLGAALLGLTWGDIQVWRGISVDNKVLIQIHLVFNTLACVGILRHFISGRGWPFVVWFMFAVFLIFAVCWYILFRER